MKKRTFVQLWRVTSPFDRVSFFDAPPVINGTFIFFWGTARYSTCSQCWDCEKRHFTTMVAKRPCGDISSTTLWVDLRKIAKKAKKFDELVAAFMVEMSMPVLLASDTTASGQGCHEGFAGATKHLLNWEAMCASGAASCVAFEHSGIGGRWGSLDLMYVGLVRWLMGTSSGRVIVEDCLVEAGLAFVLYFEFLYLCL